MIIVPKQAENHSISAQNIRTIQLLAARHATMQKRFIILILVSAFALWTFTGAQPKETENRIIRKITAQTALFLVKRKVWNLDKSVELYNRKGLITEQQFYDGSTCDSKYIYTYNNFDSLSQVIWLTGESLSPQKIELFNYDSLQRKVQNLTYEINKKTGDTTLYERTTWFYDSSNRPYKTIVEHLNTTDSLTTHVNIMTDTYDSRKLVIADTFVSKTKEGASTYITNYQYDDKGHILRKFGGLTGDSIYYKTNKVGRVVEEKEQYGSFVRTVHRYWYDDNGNEIKTYLDYDGGHTYEFVYDKNNKLLREYRPGNFMLLFRPVVTYKYEYY